MELGIKGRRELIVGTEHTAKHIGSGTVLVLATPMMIALMETTSRLSVKPYLEEGQEKVGTHVNVSHDSAVPVGNKVWCESEVIDIDRRKITFRVVVYSDDGIVGQGTHERFIIDEKKFGEKMAAKKVLPKHAKSSSLEQMSKEQGSVSMSFSTFCDPSFWVCTKLLET